MSIDLDTQSAIAMMDNVHHFATLWEIVRVDGLVLRFTDHDTKIQFQGATFTPAGGFDASARQKNDGLKNRDLEARGIISSDAITDEDLRAGRYREAKVTEYLVDWRYPWIHGTDGIVKSVYWINDVQWSETQWSAQIAGQSRWLLGNIGEFYGKPCRYTLGDDRCKVNLASFTDTGSVTGVSTQRAVFGTSGISNVAGYYTDGVLTWQTGLNAGIISEVRLHVPFNIYLHVGTPFDIFAGDTFTVSAGCDLLVRTCRDKFNNLVNHGGFPFIPGTDAMLETPNAH